MESLSGAVPRISIIIPALNEAESIGHVVSEMPWQLIAECIVVDNGSTDATASIAAEAGARVVRSQRGYGAACLAGSLAALPDSDILVFMDGDGSDIIADLARLTGPVVSGEADFVIGSRMRGQREVGSMLPSQMFAGRLVGVLLLVGQVGRRDKVRYTDMGPFRAIRRTSLERLHMSELTYGWNLEMQIKAIKCNLRVREIPVDYRRRIGGVSKVSGDFKASAKAAVRILEVLFRTGLSGHAKLEDDRLA
jgi:glycosyltransferase involved in cell wall biosynthesis